MKRNLIAMTIAASLLLGSPLSLAQGKPDLHLKSEGTAWLLGLDPIPGDALFYADKPIQGAINMALGIPCALLFFVYLPGLIYADEWDDSDMNVFAALSVLGGVGYFATLLWDAASGISGAYAHNRNVRARSASLWQRVQPTVAVTNDGAFGGLRLTF